MITLIVTICYITVSIITAAFMVEVVDRINPMLLDKFSGETIAGLAGVLWPATLAIYFCYKIGSMGRWLRGTVREIGRRM